MRVGYARVSTDDQTHRAQLDMLTKAGCERIYQEKASGTSRERPELQRMLGELMPNDVVIVFKLDRLSRSLKDLLCILDEIEDVGASFESITERVETSTPWGKALVSMLGTFAEFERAVLVERSRAGQQAARARGIHVGRPSKLTEFQRQEAIAMVRAGRSAADVARIFKVHRSTISRLLKSA